MSDPTPAFDVDRLADVVINAVVARQAAEKAATPEPSAEPTPEVSPEVSPAELAGFTAPPALAAARERQAVTRADVEARIAERRNRLGIA